MPNWCMNTLTVSGDRSEIKKFREGVKSENSDLSLDKLMPMPKELKGMIPESFLETMRNGKGVLRSLEDSESGGDFAIVDDYTIPETPEELKLASEKRERLKNKYGASSWYEWRLIRWGVKWDIKARLSKNYEDKLVYEFDSAWGPPFDWLIVISNKFSKLKFSVKYSDEGVSFEGFAIIENGECSDNMRKITEEERESMLKNK